MDKNLKPFELNRISSDPLNNIQIGDWCWVKFDDLQWVNEGEESKQVKIGEHETLMCVSEIGSNYVGFTKSTNHGSLEERIHFDHFLSRCRPETSWKEMLNAQMTAIQKAMQEKTRELRAQGQQLMLIKADNPIPNTNQDAQSCLPAKVVDAPQQYKKELIKFEQALPEITKEIDKLAVEYAIIAKDMMLPDLVRLNTIKETISQVQDRIFTIEVYAGLQETIKQIADGTPALATEKISVRQLMLFMDEETLFNYESGGMDFNSLDKFDNWIVKPENLNRMIPEQKGVVAFRVRRNRKDYGPCTSISEAFRRLQMDEENMQTYLLIRNGQKVFRIASAIDFSPRLIPLTGEIGDEQFKKSAGKWGWSLPEYEKEKVVTKDDVEFDDHVAKMDALIKKYNRVVIFLQGLLDRSFVFHPHPPINLIKRGQIDQWVNIVRDEEMGLPSTQITFEKYLEQLFKTVKPKKWVYILDQYRNARREKYSSECYVTLHGKTTVVKRPKTSYLSNLMPAICQVDSIKKDRSAIRVSWPKGECRGRYVPCKNKPGYEEWSYETDQMCHEWVPAKFVMNLSDYNLGDYKMFLCNRDLRGEYLEWAGALLNAEDWAREIAKGKDPKDSKKAKANRY